MLNFSEIDNLKLKEVTGEDLTRQNKLGEKEQTGGVSIPGLQIRLQSYNQMNSIHSRHRSNVLTDSPEINPYTYVS